MENSSDRPLFVFGFFTSMFHHSRRSQVEDIAVKTLFIILALCHFDEAQLDSSEKFVYKYNGQLEFWG